MSLKMYDDTNIDMIPRAAYAVAGYINGHWPTYPRVVAGWPHAKHLSISVNSSGNAECLDVEKGDATNEVAAGWVKRQQARGVKRPVIYTSVSNVSALLQQLRRGGVSRSQIRLWTAHYTFKSHFCSAKCYRGMPTVADATQWTDRSGGKSLDESVITDTFFGPLPKPIPVPKHYPKPPSPMPGWWWLWADWRRGGKVGPRPIDAPWRIPLWAWGSLIAYNRAHPAT